MKECIREKFKSNFKFVKPLYRKAKCKGQDVIDKRTVPINFDKTLKLCGDDFDVKTVITKSNNVINVKRKINKDYKVILPGACDEISSCGVNRLLKPTTVDYNKCRVNNIRNDNRLTIDSVHIKNKMLDPSRTEIAGTINKEEKALPANVNHTFVFQKVTDTWLRVYPAPKRPGETTGSVLIRCVVCQLGLATFLILLTIIAVFLIHSLEGPQEIKVSIDFEKDQSQLVIDLATELRQITPISPKWRYAIERRIEDQRKLTMQAVALGARIKPGRFWNLSGTFLFTVYVMTALGFGAPVPHTVWGRTAALIYAVFAVPIHIYLIMNASTCVVAYVERCTKNLQREREESSQVNEGAYKMNTGNRKRISGLAKTSHKLSVNQCLAIIGAGRFVPLAVFFYYTLGLVSFGVLRNKNSLEVVMFPLEFTTTGGLELVESYVRILYGLYVEGAMCLFACTFATMRRYSSSTLGSLSESYQLFLTEKCDNSSNSRPEGQKK